MRTFLLASAIAVAMLLARTPVVNAGCGCNKPPPPAANVRPAFAPPGGNVTLFSPLFQVGRKYNVIFAQRDTAQQVQGTAVTLRDFADGVMKPQLVVSAPTLPPGPTRIRVKNSGDILLDVAATDFTMLQAPVALAEGDGETVATCYRAAVSADGSVLIPVDISAISAHMIFSGLAMSYPLLFSGENVTIYNAQGFLMQLLGPDQAGIYAIDDPAGAPNSLELTYDRHEFQTYRDQHAHLGGLGLDPLDPNWHTDGTYHVDHDHLILAIRGTVENLGLPAPGQTPAFDLHVTTALADGTNGVVTSRTITWSDACTTPTSISNSGPSPSSGSGI
ncbi:MAG: hypothetical protein HY271_21540 [Deltaproteobacteria bacterium]|nr:hypothetical protein [Deltaproteobacteria bacterium]